ncbi:hypothetical protein GPX89_29920 [Nocardia sp. ET3-3]|uniref:DUF3137 domain-containing protein n=1 Tax=Nocardia terrae TaxID=2675851 RepID=A0A7K1V4A8_9NOCA|nr:hypothetical protein [Nocardia terrae]MVU81446.1 hypothetical protein [Nocardia terrae]
MTAFTLIFGAMCVLPFVLLIVLIPLSIARERERKARIQSWAAAHGWMFHERAGAAWTRQLPGGNRHGIGVTVTGPMGGRWVRVSEYSYRSSSGSGESETTTTHHFIVVTVQLDRPHPPLAVRNRGLMSQFGRALFGDKPTATDDVLFDAKYRIDAADPAHAKAMVSPALVAAHIARTVPLWSLHGNELLTYTAVPGPLRDPLQIPWYAGRLLQVADLLGQVVARPRDLPPD